MKSTAILMFMAISTTLGTARPTFDKIAEAILDVVAADPYLGYAPEKGSYHQHYHNDHHYYVNQPNGGQHNGYYQKPSGYYQQPNGGYPVYQRNPYPSRPAEAILYARPSYTQGPDPQWNYQQGPYNQGNYGGASGYARRQGYKTNGY